MRTDGRANRDRIVAVARRLFADVGSERVTMARIARGADVTVTTLYRHFPTREELVAQAYGSQWSECAHNLAVDSQHPVAGEALCRLLRRLCEDQVRDRGLTPALIATLFTGEGMAASEAGGNGVIASLLERARAEGSVRADLTLDDIKILIAGHQGVIDTAGPEASGRYLTHMLSSFRAPGTGVPAVHVTTGTPRSGPHAI